ncbi:hypothetical protein B0H67DRAFT_220594 [Lasiosphaeris hirsuta]|uniref:Zn(2)-C6 fungal-type domain-containing protein n=1 Tax=Lasiosphaeris hirsuta TaxID=260670 RepID=A0AA40DWW2_9PEZI|nr:hypothetical protein B0H67DRAFT_220594 [Lasiosphaeris hirsuta]
MSWPKPDSSSWRTATLMPKVSGRDGRSGPNTIVFTLQHRPRATRASVPKVRSGCITCKRRHVKCDEAKPACQRCLKWQGNCDGYGNSDVPGAKRERSKSPTSSQSETDESATPPPSTGSPESVPGLECNGGLTELQWETTYLGNWLTLADNMGGGWFQTNLFTQTIPELGRTEPAIRYAAMAVGALASALAPSTLPELPAPPLEGNPHYDRALTYYGHALRLVRLQQDLGSQLTLRVAVIACIMFACFEALHDSCEAAINHINHGLMIVEQFMCTSTKPPGHPAPTDIPEAPRPQCFLEDEILQVFQRLEFLSWSTGLVNQTPQAPIFCRRAVPSFFADIAEARRWWDLVQRLALRGLVEKQAPNAASCGGSFPIDPALTTGQDLDKMKQWSVSFYPLYTSSIATKIADPTRYFQCTSLLLQYHSSWVSLCVANAGEAEYDLLHAMTPRFKEIVRLAAILLANQPKPAGCAEVFTMDHGPVLALFTVASRCLDPQVRGEAVALLEQYPRRDAFWDSRAVLNVIEGG